MMGTDTLQWYQGLPEEYQNQDITIIEISRHSKRVQGSAINLGEMSESSLEVRKKLRLGEETPELNPRVLEYIEQKGLYQYKNEVKTLDEVKKFFKNKNKRVITFIGHGYLEQAREILSQALPNKTVIAAIGTDRGMGKIHQLAKEMGFETIGIVSAQAKGSGELSPYMDAVFYVPDASMAKIETALKGDRRASFCRYLMENLRARYWPVQKTN